MNIGIITWFDGPNYGTNLQAIALQRYLRDAGNDVKLVNCYPTQTREVRKETFREKIARQPLKYANRYSEKKYRDLIAQKIEKLKRTIQDQCILTEMVGNENDFVKTCNQFDLLICGSDQIWNPNWYHPWYYADVRQIQTKKISYAASFGVSEIAADKIELIRNSLTGFSGISVRESKGAALVDEITDVQPEVVVDPTFLLDADYWSTFIKEDEEGREAYALSMFLTDNPSHWLAVRCFVRKQKLKHIIIPYTGFSYMQPGEVIANAGIDELLKLIKNARFILTDSFHITVFSMIFHKDFYSFMRFKEKDCVSQNSRVANLLTLTGLESRCIPYGAKRVNLCDAIDYDAVSTVLHNEITKSKAFLEKFTG